MRPFFVILIMFVSGVAIGQNYVKLSGRLQNTISDSVKISFNTDLIAFYPQEYFARLDRKGNFSISFPLPKDIYVQADFSNGSHIAQLVLRQGDSLYVEADVKHFESTIHYSGRGSEVQNFIAKRQLKRGRLNEYTLKVKTAINKEPADFLKAIALERKAETDLLKIYQAGLPDKFVKYWSAYFEYYNYFFIQQYPQIHQIIKLRRYSDTVPAENYIVLKDMPYSFHDSLLQVPSYLLYLTGVVDVKLKAAGYRYLGTDIGKIEAVQDSVNALAFEMMPDRSAEYFAAQTLYGRARSQELDRTRRQYKIFVDRWPASPYLPDIDKQMAITARLAKGQPAPDFEFHTADGKPGRLSDLKGKVVFMSFWAGFCKQCIGEMLSEKTIKESIRNKPLEFLYVSIGADTVAERAMMSKLKIDGIFTNVAGGWNSKEAQLYGVQSLPAYFLIDQDGNFGMQNPPPPTQSTRLILEIEKMFR